MKAIKEVALISTILIACSLLIVGSVFYIYLYARNLTPQVSYETLSVTDMKRTINPADQKYADVIGAEADQVMSLISEKNMNALSGFVSMKDGLRFSPYANIQTSDQIFSPNQVADFFNDNTAYTWGSYNGSGIPISLTPSAYYDRFIYDSNFAESQDVSYNRILGVSSTENNEFQFYPNTIIVEYYVPNTEAVSPAPNWESLRLVFKDENNVWYLIGLIHDESTD